MAGTEELKGRTVVITGATSGLGLQSAKELAAMGAELVLVGRTPEKLRQARDVVVIESGNWEVRTQVCDFSLLDEVRALAERLTEEHERIDVLMNNAGAVYGERVLTGDGHELTWQVNHLAPFLLTNLLKDTLNASPTARVVNVASGAHRWGRIPWDDFTYSSGWQGFKVYCDTKLANILFTRELARRWENSYIKANACHPGAVASNFGQSTDNWFATANTVLAPLLRDVEEGARTQVWLASSREANGLNGKYLKDCAVVKPRRRARSDKDAARLWEESARMVGLG